MNSLYYKRMIKLSMMLLDQVLLFAGYYAAFLIMFREGIPTRNWEAFITLAPWLGLSALIIFFFFDLYEPAGRKSFHTFAYSIIMALGLLTIVLIATSFWIRGFAMPRSVILLGIVLQGGLMLFVRSAIWFIQIKVSGRKRVLIVGKDMNSGIQMAEKFLKHSKGWFEIKGFLAIEDRKRLNDLKWQIDLVLISPDLNREERSEILSHSFRHRKEVLIVPDLYELFLMGSETQQIDDLLVFSLRPPTLSSGERVLKRALDLMVAIPLFILLLPIMVTLWVIIPLESKGKALFKQARLGKDEKEFTILKFRTMKENAESETGPTLATEGDTRITRLGHWLRLTRLDEVPQLFNVIKGDMSLVGPRPERAFFIEQFKDQLSDYAYRMAVKPGITGLAQVMAKYNTKPEDKLRYDLMYIKNYTLLLDIKLLFQTLIVVLRKEQAEGVSENQAILMEQKLHRLMSGMK